MNKILTSLISCKNLSNGAKMVATVIIVYGVISGKDVSEYIVPALAIFGLFSPIDISMIAKNVGKGKEEDDDAVKEEDEEK